MWRQETARHKAWLQEKVKASSLPSPVRNRWTLFIWPVGCLAGSLEHYLHSGLEAVSSGGSSTVSSGVHRCEDGSGTESCFGMLKAPVLAPDFH